MGYPMTYDRLVNRNLLAGNYTNVRQGDNIINHFSVDEEQRIRLISGDMRRLEQDSVTGYRLEEIAKQAGVEPQIVQRVLGAFFQGAPQIPPHDES